MSSHRLKSFTESLRRRGDIARRHGRYRDVPQRRERSRRRAAGRDRRRCVSNRHRSGRRSPRHRPSAAIRSGTANEPGKGNATHPRSNNSGSIYGRSTTFYPQNASDATESANRIASSPMDVPPFSTGSSTGILFAGTSRGRDAERELTWMYLQRVPRTGCRYWNPSPPSPARPPVKEPTTVTSPTTRDATQPPSLARHADEGTTPPSLARLPVKEPLTTAALPTTQRDHGLAPHPRTTTLPLPEPKSAHWIERQQIPQRPPIAVVARAAASRESGRARSRTFAGRSRRAAAARPTRRRCRATSPSNRAWRGVRGCSLRYRSRRAG